MEEFIVELQLPSGKVFARSPRLSLAEAESRAASVNEQATTFTAHVVPAEKYAVKGRSKDAEGPLDVRSNEHRSRVE